MQKTILSNAGFILTGSNKNLKLITKAHNYHPGFIISATNSMVNDHPIIAEIERDILKKSVPVKNSLVPFINFLVQIYLRENSGRIQEYFSKTHKQVTGWKLSIIKFNVTSSFKSGVLFREDTIVEVKLLNLTESHPVQYSRDFTGYFFEIYTLGDIIFSKGPKVVHKTGFRFSKIPILAFKSTNAVINEASRSISREIFYRLLKKETAVFFI